MIPEERKLCCNQTTLPPHQSSPFSSSRKHGPYTHNPPKPLERWSFSFSSAQWHGCSVSEKEVSQVSPWRVNQDKGTHVCPGNWKSMGGMTCLGSCRVIDSSLLGEKKRRLDRLINWVSLRLTGLKNESSETQRETLEHRRKFSFWETRSHELDRGLWISTQSSSMPEDFHLSWCSVF